MNHLWSLNFVEQPDRITHGRSLMVSDLSDLLTLLIKKEGMSESVIKQKHTKNVPKNWNLDF